jgi:uncharacterized protein involved in exopolysaccharide biosynthesis
MTEEERLVAEGLLPSEKRPPQISIPSAVRRHWILAALPLLAFTGLALAAGLARTPEFKAETRLAAGRVDADSPAGLAGFPATAASLAETYSRSVRGDAVVKPVARRLRAPENAIRSHLSAAPIPQTAVFRVQATSGSEEEAIRLSLLASRALVRESEGEARSSPGSDRLLDRYRRAEFDRQRLRGRAERRREAFEEVQTTQTRDALARARSRLAAASLNARSLRESYLDSRQSQGAESLVRIIERATAAKSDRGSVLQLLLFVAVLAGIATGVALAVVYANRRARRLYA